MNSQVRQTHIAMFLVLWFIVFLIHGMALLTCYIAVENEGLQTVAKILTLPASLYKERINKLPDPFNWIVFLAFSLGLWSTTIAGASMFFVRRQTLKVRRQRDLL